MVSYCIDFKTCKRNLIARHFNDDLWNKTGECHEMCDFCLETTSKNGKTSSEPLNCIHEARLVIETIQNYADKSSKEKRLTANKLIDLVYAELNSKKSKSTVVSNLGKLEIENLVISMLMRKYLKEDFHFTPYNTICYVINGQRSHQLQYETEFHIYVQANSKSKPVVGKQQPKQSHDEIEEIEIKSEKSSGINRNSRVKAQVLNIEEDDDDDDIQLIFQEDNLQLTNLKKKAPIVLDDDDDDDGEISNSKRTKYS
jgi:hypothetical protein